MVPYKFKLLNCIMLMCMGACKSEVQSKHSACHLEMMNLYEEYEYIQEGDIMIGGVLTVNSYATEFKHPEDNFTRILCVDATAEYYRQFLDFHYFIEQRNNNTAFFPNLTLGYHIYDSCGDPPKAVRSVLQILSGTRETVPNYSCVGKRNIAGFIGDLTSETTVPIAQILTLYGYSQISYGATDPLLRDRAAFPYFFRTVQSDHHHCYLLTELLKHFGWTWVGVIRLDDDAGDREFQLLTKYFSNNGICIEFSIKINIYNIQSREHIINKHKEQFQKSTTSVIVLCGTVSITIAEEFRLLKDVLREKTLVLTTNWAANHMIYYAIEVFNGSLGFMQRSLYELNSPEIKAFLASIHPSKYPKDKLLEDLWIQHHLCSSTNEYKNKIYEYLYPYSLHNCTGEERIQDIWNIDNALHSPWVHLAVTLLSQAMYKMHMTLSKLSPKQKKRLYNYRYQLHHYLKVLRYKVQGAPYTFDEAGEFKSQYWMYNYMIEAEENVKVQYFEFNPLAPSEQKLIPADITWKTGQCRIPRAQCSDNCPTGFRKASKPGTHSCCYGCAQCSEGEISNVTERENCTRCPDMEWPNEKRNQCVARTEEFLSYNDDVISICLLSLSVVLYLCTVLITTCFIIYRDTPIVRANNRSLSFLLLVSIKLSFLSVFLFLGRPVDITCMLRIITFGITFSIAVSSLLAKTIMVCVAFKATKPGSSWRKWLGVKLSNSVVLFCSSIQIIICMTWLAISPPFQELDIHTSPGTIIIQCNEGSAIGFYSVIGYMGLLAAVSFVLAFLARSLPDSFNEAKYITFSMLLFCSVWITMIPAYLSTKGKNTVCVEIFAILTSSAGLLFCIFLPKCYTILLRPEINMKSNLLGNKYK
ncbi:vomeronasal type-2 receptor 26 [Xenopus tropicalis]|uniref:Vomeronasal type-2 receptor 26 n=1 Tax=Xenopus tropicalis TaxID=8364 RepID=A0A8J0SE04_XENTR|nr:vomeronasal type-2 receptor 26 [Xenopus tropicalis]|eukprot:XP_012811561.1 PREDICTED: vomeronasal type-2 receptor 26-like [Xenopus tropicalis]